MDADSGIRQQLRNQLRPYFEMLLHKKRGMGLDEWKEFVKRTEHSMIESSSQYFWGLDQIEDKSIVIHELFDEFLNGKI